MIQPLGEDAEVEEYDPSGIAEYLYTCLRSHLPLDEMLDGYELPETDFIDEIEYALEEIGF